METKAKEKMNFFNRIKIAIFNLENYGIFLGERFIVAIKYFFLLLLLVSILITIVDTCKFGMMLNKAFDYINNELPEFSFNDGELNSSEIVEAYDDEYSFSLFINTDKNLDEKTINDYKNKIYDKGIILLNNKIIIRIDSQELEYKYHDLFNSYLLSINNKSEMIDEIEKMGLFSINIIFFILNFITIYLSNIIAIFTDIILVSIFGYLATKIFRIVMNKTSIIILGIYSLTLSIVLYTIYSIIFSITGFTIKYFNLMYLFIAYVYIIAAILMIKSDLIKQNIEVQKIVEVQKQIKDEIENKDEEKDEKEESEDEPEINREPDGSEI